MSLTEEPEHRGIGSGRSRAEKGFRVVIERGEGRVGFLREEVCLKGVFLLLNGGLAASATTNCDSAGRDEKITGGMVGWGEVSSDEEPGE